MWTVGAVSAFCTGLAIPGLAVIFGDIVATYDPKNEDLVDEMTVSLFANVIVLSILVFAVGYLQYAFMTQAADHFTVNLKVKLLKSLMEQDVSFLEENDSSKLTRDIDQYFIKISLGLSDGMAQLLQGFGTFFGGFLIAFYKGPVLAVLFFIFLPCFFIIVLIISKYSRLESFHKMEATTQLGIYIDEQLHSLKLIMSFAQEEQIIEQFTRKAAVCTSIAKSADRLNALFYGVFRLGALGFFVYCFYISSIFVEKRIKNPTTGKAYEIEDIVAIMMSIIMAIVSTLGLQGQLTSVIQG